MFNVERLNLAFGNKFGVQCSRWTGMQCIQVAFHCFSAGVSRDINDCSIYACVQCTQVFNLAYSTPESMLKLSTLVRSFRANAY